jgi:geranylgeranyl diphosphate synthase type I
MNELTAATCEQLLREASRPADAEIARILESYSEGPAGALYEMLRYFMGYLDETGAKVDGVAGKRFRPALCLIIADAYGARDRALDAAVAIELFHNFSLIHDDIEDGDALRRGRPTVWKRWGINHGINAGDVQSLIASRCALSAARHSEQGAALSEKLFDAFIKVGEGQYLDFELAAASLDSGEVTETKYLAMIERKSGALIAVSAEVAGIAADKEPEECARLYEYGMSLGMAFQIADDYRSVWSDTNATGKDAFGDIREHKRTLPFLYARTALTGDTKERLDELYSLNRQLTENEIQDVRAMLDMTDSNPQTLKALRSYARAAQAAAQALAVPGDVRSVLVSIVRALVPEGFE